MSANPDAQIKVLGLLQVRNGERRVKRALDSMGTYCDAVYALNDRSVDSTLAVLTAHRAVKNIFTADSALSSQPWHLPESDRLNLLYRMADLYMPNWIVMMDDDESIEPPDKLRTMLGDVDPSVAGIMLRRISAWSDKRYPLMERLMRRGVVHDGRIWRHYPGLVPGPQLIHNGYFPANLSLHGQIITLDNPVLVHRGWNTLAKRIKRVELYSALDPSCGFNDGEPYDEALLFGYTRGRIPDLIRHYRRLERGCRRGSAQATSASIRSSKSASPGRPSESVVGAQKPVGESTPDYSICFGRHHYFD